MPPVRLLTALAVGKGYLQRSPSEDKRGAPRPAHDFSFSIKGALSAQRPCGLEAVPI